MRARADWQGDIVVRRGWLLYRGPVGPTSQHSHHAFQIVRAADQPVTMRDGAGGVGEIRRAVIPPRTPHAFLEGAAGVALLYVDPDGRVGRGMRALFGDAATVARWRELAEEISPCLDEPDATRWPALLSSRFAEAPHVAVHAAMRRACREIEAHLPTPIRLGPIAEAAGVSPSHLVRLFREQLGLPFRRYVLWARLLRAGDSFATNRTVVEAAHAAGFADAAHLSRTFRRMFGVAPSDLAGARWNIESDGRAHDER